MTLFPYFRVTNYVRTLWVFIYILLNLGMQMCFFPLLVESYVYNASENLLVYATATMAAFGRFLVNFNSCNNHNKCTSLALIHELSPIKIIMINTRGGPGSSVGIATDYELDLRGSNPSGARFSAVQTGPGTHPVSCTMVTGSFPGVENGRGVTLNPHLLLVPRSKNRVELYLYPPKGPSWPIKNGEIYLPD